MKRYTEYHAHFIGDWNEIIYSGSRTRLIKAAGEFVKHYPSLIGFIIHSREKVTK